MKVKLHMTIMGDIVTAAFMTHVTNADCTAIKPSGTTTTRFVPGLLPSLHRSLLLRK